MVWEHIEATAAQRALLAEEFVQEKDVQAYADVLLREASAAQGVGRRNAVRPVSAASDFAPIYESTKRLTKRGRGSKAERNVPEGVAYSALRWPLLCIVLAIISVEFFLYVSVRQMVNVMEKLGSWRGESGRLRQKLRDARTYSEWKRAALEFDAARQYDEWKARDASPFYDWRLVQRVIAALKTTRKNEDTHALMGVLNLCLKPGFAGIENAPLYSQSFYGTKQLIEQYYHEVDEALAYVARAPLDARTKRAFYRMASRNVGRAALCLSGGASFAYYHFGIVRALLDADLLPTIVSGTSAGGLIASLVCTRTNDELKELLVPALADRLTGCDESFLVWLPRMWKTGARFDTLRWVRKAQFFTRGSMTFREAYERTGKTLNISVVPFDQHSPAQLLNHITAPDCLIWSAVIASAAVPGILNPVFLMQKRKDGTLEPWSYGNKFRDGSLRVDIPLDALHSTFNVTYPVVAQANPHVHLFHFGSRGSPGRPTAYRRGRGWRGGFVLSAAEHVLKLNMLTNVKILRDLNLLPKMLGQDWSSVFLQQFQGSITIYPKTRALDWPRILTDPSRHDLLRMMRSGQYVTFPKLHMMHQRMCIERAIASGRAALRAERDAALAEHSGSEMDAEMRDASNDATRLILEPSSQDAASLRHSSEEPDTEALERTADLGDLLEQVEREAAADAAADAPADGAPSRASTLDQRRRSSRFYGASSPSLRASSAHAEMWSRAPPWDEIDEGDSEE